MPPPGSVASPPGATRSAAALPRSVQADLSSPPPFADADAALSVGDLAPDWVLSTVGGQPFSIFHDAVAGRTRVLLLAGAPELTDSAIAGFDDEARRLIECDALLYVVWRKGDAPRRTSARIQGLVDIRSELAAELAEPSGQPRLVVLRANQHLAALEAADASGLAAVRHLCERLQSARDTDAMSSLPPVLLVPDVLSAAECRELIHVFNTRGQVLVQSDKAIDYFGADYKMQVPEHMRQDRIDHFFFEKSTVDFLLRRLMRVEVEVARAFHYRITRHETLRVARYEGTRAGHGYGHRDNRGDHRHRRFALSLNLNTEEFEGGGLRFPEFGDRRFRPPTGAAFVFSSSLLHEAMQVTSGTRYVLLSFMFGDI